MLQHWIKIVVAAALALTCMTAVAENDENGSASGAGQVTLRPKATMLRFQLALSERGDDMEQVEKSLARKCEAFRKALLAAKAMPGSIRIDTVRLAGGLRAVGPLIQGQQPWGKGKWQYQKPAQMPPQQQFQSPSLTPPASQGPPSPTPPERREPRITLQTQIAAAWPLQASTAPKLLVEADGIVRQVHEQILPIIPRKRASTSRPASDNQTEEPFAANPAANNSPAPNPGSNNQAANEPFDSDDSSNVEVCVPTYVFVGVVSQNELHEAYIKAFKDASADAKAKADVAGLAVGRLNYLEVSRPRVDSESDPFGSPYSSTPELPGGMLPPVGVGHAAAAGHAGSVEVANYDPSSLQYSVSVSVNFRLQPLRDRAAESK
jgi:uncharacterized protein YggE